ncbi:MAG: hypothetical protein K6U74_09090, partial [Firmicutes bacterium]|nr:hypothetical protein [Bacillota bacterium]
MAGILKLIGVVAVILWFAFPLTAGAALPSEPGDEILLLRDTPARFNQWSFEDYQHLRQWQEKYKDDPEKIKALVYAEWEAITGYMAKIALSEAYYETSRGYTVYPSKTSGKLHVLGAAKASRESFLELADRGILSASDFKDIYQDISRG